MKRASPSDGIVGIARQDSKQVGFSEDVRIGEQPSQGPTVELVTQPLFAACRDESVNQPLFAGCHIAGTPLREEVDRPCYQARYP